MMKYMLTATALVLILMVMWLPARTPPEIFEETALREALMLRTGEGDSHARDGRESGG